MLNKTLLRVFKKHFTTLFYDKTQFSSLQVSEKPLKYRQFISSFVEELYGEKLRSCENGSPIAIIELENFIGMIINPTYGKLKLNDKKCLRFSKLYYEVLYSYSHFKLSKMFANPVLSYLFDDLYSSNVFNEAIDSDETL